MPRYFKRMEENNLNGPPLLSGVGVRPSRFLYQEFEEEMQNPLVTDSCGHKVALRFCGKHIFPNAL